MPIFDITWLVSIEAESPEAAALAARELQLTEDNQSEFFTVENCETGETKGIDTSKL